MYIKESTVQEVNADGTRVIDVYAIADPGENMEPNVDALPGLPTGCTASPDSVIFRPDDGAVSVADSTKFRLQA